MKILIVDHDESTLKSLRSRVAARGDSVIHAHDIGEAIRECLHSGPDAILTEHSLQDGTAVNLIEQLRALDIETPVVIMSEAATIPLAVETVKRGAEHLLPKPIDFELLMTVLERSVERLRALHKERATTLERVRYVRDPFLGRSAAIQSLKTAAERLTAVNATIFIHGETGTGKGVLARWFHRSGKRSHEPFIDLNCAGLSPELLESEIFGHRRGAFTGAVENKVGFLEAADHGVLFLDEIGEMHPQVQPKLLKVVEEKRYHRLGDVQERKADVQIITASHRDLKMMAEAGLFRSDLYFRISILHLDIPPLRQRREDILILADWILEQMSWDMKCGALHLSESARSALLDYSWPGNVRELRNVLERAVILSEGKTIQIAELELARPLTPSSATPPQEAKTLRELEKQHIAHVLHLEQRNISRAASRLGITRATLYTKIHEHQL